MNIVLNTQELVKNLKLLNQIIPQKATPAILSNFLLQAQADDILLIGFDGCIAYQVKISGAVDTPGKITLPAKLTYNLLNQIHDPEIRIIVGADLLTQIVAGDSNLELSGLDPEEYPELEKLEGEAIEISLPNSLVNQGLNYTAFAASNDISKQILGGVYLTTCNQPNTLEFAATDAHRVSVINFDLDTNQQDELPELKSIVPLKLINILQKITQKTDAETLIKVSESSISFQVGDHQITSAKIPGDYPNYTQLYPGIFEHQFIINRIDLINCLEKALIIAAKTKLVKFSLQETLEIIAESTDCGSYHEEKTVNLIGDDLEIAFNLNYLVTGLKHMNSQEIKFLINQSNTPVCIKPLDNSNFNYLVMPVQIR